MIAKAADHLFLALDKPASPQNQRWLASYYYQQYKNGKVAASERASIALEKLLGIKENPQTTFEDLILSSSHVSSYFALAATVEKAKLDFSSLKSFDKHEDVPTLQTICNTLKDVQIKRKLHSEPLHLEAALYYVECKSELVPAP